MSVNNLFSPNDHHIYCNQLTSNSVIGSDTLYTASSSLTGDRTVDLDGHTLELGINNINITDLGTTVDKNILVNANIQLNGPVFDANSSAGLASQFLSTNGANVEWVDLPEIYGPTGPTGATGIQGITGMTGATGPSNFISTYTQNIPGNYNVVVPALAKSAILSGVGGGAGGWLHTGFASPGGGAGGAIFNYPISVLAGQTINITVGAGGAVNSDGDDTVFNLGSQTITCGKGLTSPDELKGGNGGSVNLGFTTIAGGTGGAFQTVGFNGVLSYFVCSGAGGGGVRADGGDALLFSGGIADSNYGGGGASIYANGGDNHTSGTLGSGGGADGGLGGDGYISISFYS